MSSHLDALTETMLAHSQLVEHGYLKHECGHRMTDDQLATLNTALGLVKTRSYRPYCLKDGCKLMPRMSLQPLGFDCHCCSNGIGFDLRPRKSTP